MPTTSMTVMTMSLLNNLTLSSPTSRTGCNSRQMPQVRLLRLWSRSALSSHEYVGVGGARLHVADPLKVRRSPQAKAFFRKCCKEQGCRDLELSPHCKTRWGTWYQVLDRFRDLRKVIWIFSSRCLCHRLISSLQAVIYFVNNADDSNEVPKVDGDSKPYSDFKLSNDEWDLVDIMHEVLYVCVSLRRPKAYH
jgi:hypothetical protein